MKEINLQYLGKKTSSEIRNVGLTKPIVVRKGDSFWVCEQDANWLLQVNPKMFVKVGERDQVVEEPELFGEEDSQEKTETFVCEICGMSYESKYWYDKHVEKCKCKQAQ